MDRIRVLKDLSASLRDVAARVGRLEASQQSSPFPSPSFGAGLRRVRDDLARLLVQVDALCRVGRPPEP
ncbi:hypothetical protein [Rubrivirga marina]|uniref:Uncharacterized protein n=1 Tax=Rubrivirga marina TaxID=1196024 RepID=A0A271IVB3_9BACT|nr:hypothetical protein [Rubrivirga marina]PAP75186.1 hypothetical protein BSZ37_01370 [Rubrivirga marina]